MVYKIANKMRTSPWVVQWIRATQCDVHTYTPVVVISIQGSLIKFTSHLPSVEPVWYSNRRRQQNCVWDHDVCDYIEGLWVMWWVSDGVVWWVGDSVHGRASWTVVTGGDSEISRPSAMRMCGVRLEGY